MQRVRSTILRDYFVPSRMAQFTALRPVARQAPPRGPFHRFSARIVDANSRAYDAVLGIPERIEDDILMLRDRDERRMLRRALVDDRLLTGERRKAILSIATWLLALGWVIAGIVVLLVQRDSLTFYRAGVSLFFYSFATSIFLPTPFEFLLSSSVKVLGVFWTIIISACAKTVGSWAVLLAGDKANEGLRQLLARSSMLERAFDALQRFAQRWGYSFIFVVFAIPFMADTVPLFIAAVLRMRKLPFLAVTFAAIVVRSLLYLFAPGLISDAIDLF